MGLLFRLVLILGILAGGAYVVLLLAGEDPAMFAERQIEKLRQAVATPPPGPTAVGGRPATPTPVASAPQPAPPRPSPTTSAPRATASTPTSVAAPDPALEPLWVYDTGGVGLRVRSSPHITPENRLGTVSDGTRFLVGGSPQSADGYTWRQVRLEGWSAANWLTPVPSTGNFVQVSGTGGAGLRVRSGPGTTADNILGKVFDGARLHVLEGPQNADGYQWWRISLEGWAASRYLSHSPTPVTQVSAPSPADVRGKLDRLQRVHNSPPLPLPSSDLVLVRALAPAIVERSDELYFLSLDYRLLSIKTARFARSILNLGDVDLAFGYANRAWRYERLSAELYEGSAEQLLAAVDVSQRLVVLRGAETALEIASHALGPPGVVAADIFLAYVDYSIDTAVHRKSVEEARRAQLTNLVVKQVFQLPSVKNAIGQPITKFVGKDSGLYQSMEGLMLSPEVKAEIVRTVAVTSEDLLIVAASKDAQVLANQVVEILEDAVAGNLP